MSTGILLACGAGDCAMGAATWVGPSLSAAGKFIAIGAVFWLVLRYVFRVKKLRWSLGVVVAVMAIGAGLYFSALATARHKARLTSSMCRLMQIGAAISQFSSDYGDLCPKDLYALSNQLGTLDVLIDPATCKPFIYVGAGVKWQSNPDLMLAFAPSDGRGRNILFNDGHVAFIKEKSFGEMIQRGALPPGAYF